MQKFAFHGPAALQICAQIVQCDTKYLNVIMLYAAARFHVLFQFGGSPRAYKLEYDFSTPVPRWGSFLNFNGSFDAPSP